MAATLRPRLSKADEDNLRAQLSQLIDQARRGSARAAAQAARIMVQLGCFDGPAAARRRYVFARWMDGVHPDTAAEGWAMWLAGGGR